MSTATHSNEKIHEALQLLEQAAKEKREELQKAVAGKYETVKEVLTGAVPAARDWLREKGQVVGGAAGVARDATVEAVKNAAGTVDQSVHDHPWPYIGGAAVVALLLGFLLGRKE